MSARYTIEEQTDAHMIIRDVGPWDRHATVTNDVHAVVRQLAHQLHGRRLYYYDSTGSLDEIKVSFAGEFLRFEHGGPK